MLLIQRQIKTNKRSPKRPQFQKIIIIKKQQDSRWKDIGEIFKFFRGRL